MTPTTPSLFRNPISLAGFGLCALSLPPVLFLLLADFFATKTRPYVGILTYLVLPLILSLGLGLALVGALWEGWRRRRGLGRGALPRIDLNEARGRRTVLIIGVVGVGLSVIGAVGSYRAYEFTDSVAFCGEVCHRVMEPEYVAYQNSAHARVTCAGCHVGPGAEWYVKSKLSGAYQVYAVLLNKYPRPIPTPIENLRPAQETCEQCHWPEKFFGGQLVTRIHFAADEGNTRAETVMLVKTGGGSPFHGPSQGIHWHMNINNKVTYVELDPRRQIIPWVRVEHPDGRVIEYVSKENPITPEVLAAAPRRRMDCMDCHNRPSHVFLSPDRAMNLVLLRGRVDPELPFIKRRGVEALAQNYASREEGEQRIRESLTAFYAERYPEVARTRKEAVEAAIAEIQRMYRENNFPRMGVTWRAYPDNIGHKEFPGCFRCHDGKHVSADGRVLSRECAACHDFLVKGKDGRTMVPAKTEPAFAHPWKLGGRHAEIGCHQCHSGGIPLESSCAGCHGLVPTVHATFACASCHLQEQVVNPLAQCTGCHVQRVRLHAGAGHVTLSCTNCHRPHAWKVVGRSLCEGCHSDKRDHNAGYDCWGCHRFGQPGLVAAAAAVPPGRPKKVTPEGGGDLVYEGAPGSPGPVTFRHATHAPRGLGCTECHTRLFPLARGKGRLTMASMVAGQNCGVCHNGTKAFAAMDATRCMTCHPAAGAPAAARLAPAPPAGPEDFAFATGPGSLGAVTFSHAKHLAKTPNCADCHPQPFGMQKGNAKLTMADMAAGRTCGTCHNGQKAFEALDASKCLTCHKP